MRKEQHDIEDILRQSFKETKLELPSSDFTTDVMSKIHSIASTEKMVYSSLIPDPVKIGLGFIFGCVLVYFILGSDFESTSLLSTYFNLPELSFGLPDLQFNLEISNVILYGMVFFMVLFSIQIYVIKTKVSRLKL